MPVRPLATTTTTAAAIEAAITIGAESRTGTITAANHITTMKEAVVPTALFAVIKGTLVAIALPAVMKTTANPMSTNIISAYTVD